MKGFGEEGDLCWLAKIIMERYLGSWMIFIVMDERIRARKRASGLAEI